MKRTISIVLFVAAAFVVGSMFRPSAVTAGHTAGLSGRTHLIVKEHNLKQLVVPSTPFDCGNVMSLHERLRNGALSPAAYTVPVGRVFIVTDVKIVGGLSNLNCPFGPCRFRAIEVDLRANGNARRHYTEQTTTPNGDALCVESYTAGLAFDAGTAIDFQVDPNFCSFAGFASGPFSIEVIGYETVDV